MAQLVKGLMCDDMDLRDPQHPHKGLVLGN